MGPTITAADIDDVLGALRAFLEVKGIPLAAAN